ncbi:glyoxalase [Pedobacter lusitanus]|uniref:Glyoxalase n=1 Tax=Pedobacter lusitanus TaxID=1503925 RepID=A0A0D0GWW8_9SPHI|nr:VOC family protein [Pedobacter lusitanus]KIO78906.1 glyoxalase [Pedobacter lusitanus]
MNIPQEHQTVMPYLMLKNASAFIDFTKTVFNAQPIESMQKPRADGSGLMHAEIMIGTSTIMFCDASEDWQPQTANLFVYVESADETYKKALDAGAESLMGLSDQNYGRTCGIKDQFGNVWWITSIL